MHMPKTLYLLADGGRVRYVERTGLGQFRTFRKFVSAHIHEKGYKLLRDRPARVQESATSTRHGIERRITPRDKIEQKFIKEVAADLLEDKTIADFDNVVIVETPRLLKVFRDSLPSAISSKLVESIDKDLTKIPDGELDRHLPEFLNSKVAS
jgi:protein required for attachment to host cells